MKDVLLYPLQNLNEYKEVISYIEESDGAALVNGLLPMQKPHIAYSVFKELKKQILFIANSDLEAKKVYEDLDGYIKGKVEYLSSQDIYFYHLDAKDRSEEAKKLKTLFKLAKGEKVIVVTSAEAILRKYIPKKVLIDNVITYKVGDTVDIEKLTNTLVNLGYERVSKIEGFGQFSIRGGIIDIFSLEYTNPIRMELFDDEVDSIRTFDVFSQMSIEKIKKIVITPSREFIYPEELDKIVKNLKKEINVDSIRTFDVFSQMSIEKIKKIVITPSREFIYPEELDKIVKNLKKEINYNTDDDAISNIDKISSKTYFEGVENYIDYIYPQENKSIFTYLDEDAVIFTQDVTRLKEKCENYFEEFKDNYKVNLERGLALKSQGKLIYTYNDLSYLIENRSILLNTLLARQINEFNIKRIINFDSREIPPYNGKLELLAEDLNRLKYNGNKVVLVTSTLDRAKKLSKDLLEFNVETIVSKNRDVEIKSSQIIICPGNISRGFEYKSIKFVVITDNEIIGVQKRTSTKKKKKKNKNGQKIDSFLDLIIFILRKIKVSLLT